MQRSKGQCELEPRPTARIARGRAWFAAPVAGAVLAAGTSCSGSGSTSSTATPLTLVTECDEICQQLASCGVTAASLQAQCSSACGDLWLVQAGCLDAFASYMACLAGATSVQCGAGGQYVVVTPPSCDSYRESFLTCSAGPSPVAACIALPGNTACGTVAAPSSNPSFCVGVPEGCVSPEPNPLGLGTFCCPATP